MSLPTWLAAGWLQPHKTSPGEIRDLWQIVSRDLNDAASGGISADWQYGIAYNAALKLCTILLYAEGYKPAKGAMAHSRTLHALPHILGASRQGDADYLEGCRQKRNTVEYDYAGGATRRDAGQLIAFGHELRADVLAWLRKKHPKLAPE
ncbi:MAG: hypothetical protein Q7S40_15825 [Opitutaceae bacterium]|nr:hypothetical protein [Opitutaceae bacterium]